LGGLSSPSKLAVRSVLRTSGQKNYGLGNIIKAALTFQFRAASGLWMGSTEQAFGSSFSLKQYPHATDCRHIATATINKVDFLVSWNFKHIVNVFRIRGYNSINLRCGYSLLDIRSPKEIVNNEDDK
jgi:hypothetical protein